MEVKEIKRRSMKFINGKYHLLLGMFLSVGLSVLAQDDSLYVIANVRGAPDEMKSAALKSVFHGERASWSNGTKVILAMIKTSTSIGKVVSEKIYGFTPEEVRGFWSRMSFAGKFDSPNVFNTVPEVESFVAANPGAIAIIDKPVSNSLVKTVKIDGKYLFR